jgi:TRAP-type C4-dicarboxylate transport system substrate-binding protein
MQLLRPVVVATCLLAAAAASAQQVQLKVATLAPDGSKWMTAARRAAEEISSRTGDRVAVRYYPGGTMGTDQAVLRKMRIGQLHGGAILIGSLTDVEPNVELYNLPLLFHDSSEVDAVRAAFDTRLLGMLADKGFEAFGFVETGFVYLMSTRAVGSFADLEGRKIWMPEGDAISQAIADAAGLSPVPLAIADVLTGLQTGLVDTVAAPPVGAVALQWFTKATYVTDLPVTYVYGTLVVTEESMGRMSEPDRAVVREVLTATVTELDRGAREDNEQARQALARQGVTFIAPNDEMQRRWTSVAAEATQTLVGRQRYDRALLSEIQKVLEEHRAGRGPTAGGG